MNTLTLHTALKGLADTLETAAADVPWTPDVCVTPIEPGVDCEAIHVWPGALETEQLRGECAFLSFAVLNWRIATCIGSDVTESCAWWTERSQTPLERLWGVFGGLLNAYDDGTLCAAMGDLSCRDVSIQAVNPQPSADYVAWQGSIRVQLDVTQIGS